MDLVIYKQDRFFAEDFIIYLCQLIQQLLLSSNIDFELFNQYFSKNYTNEIIAQNILINAGQNLQVLDYAEIIIIQINENILFRGTQRRLIDLCKLLNYGALDIQGTNIFSDTFDYVANNINQIYLNYILEM